MEATATASLQHLILTKVNERNWATLLQEYTTLLSAAQPVAALDAMQRQREAIIGCALRTNEIDELVNNLATLKTHAIFTQSEAETYITCFCAKGHAFARKYYQLPLRRIPFSSRSQPATTMITQRAASPKKKAAPKRVNARRGSATKLN